ncbi:MAG: hypothetical protein RBT34_13685, partial [Anaerolineaceae bacterium]|nr:hypothetical protein [Anaerolineaceae bacterium]
TFLCGRPSSQEGLFYFVHFAGLALSFRGRISYNVNAAPSVIAEERFCQEAINMPEQVSLPGYA